MGSLTDLDSLNLLLQEQDEELLLGLRLAQDLVEALKVQIAGHKSWRHTVHEDLSELAVARLNNLG
jgi:hypothetical protein